ncbi:DUF134 domain-containing protein [Solidesulfovibrio sp. C21]|uniref:DUF134 domain-containing protein n=1 Tax=Solidesulfovibrio sp. C21 TaxID=3398613 RepID=UPI0039FCB649
MPRPRLRRWVAGIPKATYFKPQGIPLCELVEIRLSIEGLEALRLADMEGLTTEAAAVGMGVSRHTFGRVLAEARTRVARALVGGAALRIEGGHYEVAQGQDAARLRAARPVGGGYVVAVPSQGPTLDSLVDPRFDRAAGFTLVNLADMSFQYLENTRPAGRGRGAVMHFLRNLRDAGAHALLASPPHPGFLNAVSRAGLDFIEHVPLSMEETVGEAAGRLAADATNNESGPCDGQEA